MQNEQVNIRLEPEVAERLRVLSAKTRKTFGELVTPAINSMWTKHQVVTDAASR